MRQLVQSLLGAVIFYTALPIPGNWAVEFERIARWAPLIGLLIGAILGLFDAVTFWLGIPHLTRSALTIALWIAITGGLHLDGAIDTADGLAAAQERQLEVMKDSVTGAFGVMAAGVLLLLKTAALNDIQSDRLLGLMASAGWGRWGQVTAIAFYPYLKATGKGAFHQQAIRLPTDILLGPAFLLGLSGLQIIISPDRWQTIIWMTLSGCAVSLTSGWWFKYQLGGHTGDTYGAVVEWTETLLLCLYTCLL